jgi:DNA polymerase III subunit epsilon
MSRLVEDVAGCFPTGRHYAGIAHLLRASVRGVVEGFSADAPWVELPIALIDVETTGRDAERDRVVELGIVVGRNGKVESRHNWLINPGMPIAAEAQAVHGISDADVKDAPSFAAIAAEVEAIFASAVPAAYNAAFDRGFLLAEFARAGRDVTKTKALARAAQWIDPLVWAREIHSDEKSRALGDVAARLGIQLENAHRAKDDAEAALMVLYTLGREQRVPKSYGALVQEQRRLGFAQADERRMWRSS